MSWGFGCRCIIIATVIMIVLLLFLSLLLRRNTFFLQFKASISTWHRFLNFETDAVMSLFLHEPVGLRDFLYNVLIRDEMFASLRTNRGTAGLIFISLLWGTPTCLMHNLHCSKLVWYHLVWNEHISQWQLWYIVRACGRQSCLTVIIRSFHFL